MPPTIPANPAMCSICPRSKKTHHPKKLVRFDSIVDTFSMSDFNLNGNQRVRVTSSRHRKSSDKSSHDSWQGHDSDQDDMDSSDGWEIVIPDSDE